MTIQMLIQIDKLVQLLESPVFTCPTSTSLLPAQQWDPVQLMINTVDLRLQLLEPEKYPHLYKCLYGLLMLLPQSSAFAALKNRLNSVSAIGFLHIAPRPYVILLLIQLISSFSYRLLDYLPCPAILPGSAFLDCQTPT